MHIVLRLFGPTRKTKDIKSQAKVGKGRKWPENSVTAATIYWSLSRLYLLWMIGSSWSKSAHYHGNLISKSCRSRVTHLYNRKSRIKWWCPIPRQADNLGSVTRHPANFGAITRHAKTLCHPHLIWRNVWADLDSMVFGYPFASFQLWMCLKINTIVSFSMGQVHWIFLKFCYRATQRSNETVDGLIADLAHCRCDGKDGVICNQAQGCNRAISVTCM